jgi:hypothetical protein
MKRLISFLVLLSSIISNGQGISYNNFITDTIYLKPFTASKIVSYEFDSVTFYVDYEDYKKEFYSLWKTYHNGMKDAEKAKRNGQYYNKDYEKRWPFIDSIYSILINQVLKNDTIFLTHKMFAKAHLSDLNDFFPNLIEKNRCSILSKDGMRQTILIRQNGSYIHGSSSFGGRRYFLLGHKEYFIQATDWES